MSIPDNIQYLVHKDIDKIKWDNCIHKASNSLIYASSLYLDAMSKNWDALVLDDYEAVMPLTWNKKYGIDYLYQPFFTASLGVFGNKLNASITQRFLNAIPKKFIYWEIDLNEQNLLDKEVADKKIYAVKRVNIFLPLPENYEKIAAGYSRLARRKLKNSIQYEVVINTNTEPGIIIDQYSTHYEKGNGAVPKTAYKQL